LRITGLKERIIVKVNALFVSGRSMLFNNFSKLFIPSFFYFI
jgi:hypothetical protein